MWRYTIVVLIAVLTVQAQNRAMAEKFVDIYGGLSSATDADATARIIVGDEEVRETTEFDDSFTVGVRGGMWFEGVPYLGWAIDFSYFSLPGPRLDIDTVAMSALLMARAPLFRSADFPNGRLQPYAGVGPGFYFTYASADFQPALSREISGFDINVGLDARLGLAWQLGKSSALFGEYRYTDFDINVDNRRGNFFLNVPPSTKETLDTRVRAHHFLIGISYRF